MGAALNFVIFAGASAIFAALLWLAGSRHGGRRWQIVARTLLPFLLLFGLLLHATIDERGSRLSAEITGYSLPLDALRPSREETTLFIVGDRSANADLIVKPFLQANLNAPLDAMPGRRHVRVLGSRSVEEPEAVEVVLELVGYKGSVEDDIPGSLVTLGAEEPCVVERVWPPGDGSRARRILLLPGKSLTVHIHRLDPEKACGIATRRFVERRSFTLTLAKETRAGGRDIRIALDRPLRAEAGTCRKPRDILLPASDDNARPAGYLMPRNLEFAALGKGGHANAVMRSTAFGPVTGSTRICDRLNTPITWPRQTSGSTATLDLGFTLLVLPWLPVWLLGAACAAVLLLGYRAQRDSLAERVLMPAMLYMLALRAMVAIASAANDPGELASSFYADAAVAIIVLPPMLAALIRPAGCTVRREWIAWAGIMAALLAITALWHRTMIFAFEDWALIVPAFVMLALRAGFADRNPFEEAARWVIATSTRQLPAPPLYQRLVLSPAGKAVNLCVYTPIDWFATRFPILAPLLAPMLKSTGLRIGVAILVLAFGIRIALLVLFGMQERIAGFPISIVYLPVLFVGFAVCMAAFARMREHGMVAGLWIASALLLAGVVAPERVNDNGFILVHLLPICLVGAYFLLCNREEPAGRRHGKAGLAMLPFLLLLLVLGHSAWKTVSGIGDRSAPIADQMRDTLEYEGNGMRLLQIIRPSAVEEVGTRIAYDQMEQTAMLDSLSNTLTGNLWLSPIDLLSIRKEQAWDYVSAVHIMYPFGRLGAVAFLLVLFAMAAALYRAGARHDYASPSLGQKPAAIQLVGDMALVTLVFSACYGVLGNLLLVPFTGRNLYLLASRSTGDLIEGLMLFTLAALAVRKGAA